MDGWVVVGTKLDTKQLEKDLKSAKKQLQQYEKEADKLTKSKAKAELDLQPYEEQKRLIKELTDEANRYANSKQETTNNLNIEKKQLEELNNKYSIQLSKLEEINSKIKQNEMSQELVKGEIEETNNKLSQAKGLDNFKDIIKKISDSTGDAIKKVGKWALAIFGVRTAYNMIRNSLSVISQQDQQLATDIEYMKNALAYTLEPIVRAIVDLAKKLLFYVGYIIKAWTGKNIFENANKSLGKANKEAKKLSKTLAGFDEMNILSDNSSAGGSAGATPSFDLANPENVPIPEWIKWIAENKDVVLATLSGISAGLIACHYGLSLIKGLGIGVIVAGLVLLIQDIIAMIKDPSWENFFKILGDISIIIGGIMLLMGNWWGLLVVFIGEIVRLVAENWDTIKAILLKVWEWVKKYVVEPVWTIIKALFDTVLSIIKTFLSTAKGIFVTLVEVVKLPFTILKDTVSGVVKGVTTTIKGLFNVIKGIFTGDWKTVMDGFKSIFKGTFDALWTIAKAPLNLVIGGINSLIKGLNKIQFDVPDWVPEIGGKKLGFNIPTIPKLAKGTILNNPGYGVPVAGGSAIAGEAGREAYLPLSDTQLLEELGSTIGKYITINANITNSMNGRVISRELKKINASDNFAMNK